MRTLRRLPILLFATLLSCLRIVLIAVEAQRQVPRTVATAPWHGKGACIAFVIQGEIELDDTFCWIHFEARFIAHEKRSANWGLILPPSLVPLIHVAKGTTPQLNGGCLEDSALA